MKVSSLSTGTIEQTLNVSHDAKPFLAMVQQMVKSLLGAVNHIGTSIALGESGNLDAADEFRKKNSGQ